MKPFTDLFINKPVLATVLSLLLLLMGLRAFDALPLRQFPMLDTSVIHIQTTYAGASAALIESYVTSPIENSLNGVSGIDYVQSHSRQGVSDITIQFQLGYDINKANADVSNAVSSVRYQLPQSVDDPIIDKADPNAEPMLYISFSDPDWSEEAIGDYLRRVIQPQLATLPDVGQVSILANMYAMRIWLDPQKMMAKGLDAEDVHTALSDNHSQSAAGRLEANEQEWPLSVNTALQTAQQFNDLVVRTTANKDLIRLQDIGYAQLGAQSYRSSAVINGQRTTVLAITASTNGNPLVVAKQLKAVFPALQQHLPKGMHANILLDLSSFIQASLEEVLQTVAIAAVAVMAVIFLFLGSWRAVLIPLVTIPLSLLGVSIIMQWLGYSLNSLTFLAWVLAIGLVVDDAIVVLENIYRHMEEGLSALQAALRGAREIAFAVIAMTITLATVYAPIGLTAGLTGVLFREFAFTLASAVLVSGWIALTLSPMMCAKWLRISAKPTLSTRIDQLFERLSALYQRVLARALARKWSVVAVALLIYGGCAGLFASLDRELAPNEDQGFLISIIRAPTSANLAYTEKYTAQLNSVFSAVPERENYGIINGWPNGVNTAVSFLMLKPWGQRQRSVQQVIDSLLPQMMAIPGVLAFPFNPPPLPGASGDSPVAFVLKSMGDYGQLVQAANTLMAAAKQNPGLVNVDSDSQTDQVEWQVLIDHDKANSLGISMARISQTFNLFFGEPTLDYFERQGQSYPIITQLAHGFGQNPEQLNTLPIKNQAGQILPLGNILQTEERITPQQLLHFQQQRAVTITAGLASGYSLGQALDFFKKTAHSQLDPSISYDFAGQSRQFMQSQGAMGQAFLFALLCIYLVLAAQFESFRQPLMVMLSVPLSLFGALLMLHATHCTLNIYTQIGLITLVGLITKHGILMVEFTEQRRRQGLALREALIGACAIRLRPILMTTATMVLGAMPLILAAGAGAESRRQLGWVIVAGMGIGTCFTLFIIPTAYLLLAKSKRNDHESRGF